MSEIRRLLRTRSFAFALLLSVVLLIANIVVLPSFGSPSNFDTNLSSSRRSRSSRWPRRRRS